MLSLKTNSLYFIFKLGGECFGISVDSIREIIDEQNTINSEHPLPCFLGHHSYREEHIPIIDISLKLNPLRFNLKHPKKILITEIQYHDTTFCYGFKIDYAHEIINLEDTPIIHNNRRNCGFILGYVEVENCFVTLLDINKLLHIDELRVLQASKQIAYPLDLEV